MVCYFICNSPVALSVTDREFVDEKLLLAVNGDAQL